VIRRLLAARGSWLLLGVLLLASVSRIAVRGLARDPRFDATPGIAGVRGPAWGGEALVEPVVARLKALGPVNLFDPAFEQRIAGALREVPGIASVDRLRKLWPRRYAVEFTFHRPVAVVEQHASSSPVTRDGVVLPFEPYEHACRGLPRILGVADRPPAPGARWTSVALLDGLATVEQLAPHLATLAPLGLDRIDVSRCADARQGVTLLGSDGTSVRWGRPRATVAENPVERKIRYLGISARNLAQVRGREIDVRYGDLYLRESGADASTVRSAP